MKARFHYVRKFAGMTFRYMPLLSRHPTWLRVSLAATFLFVLASSHRAFGQAADTLDCNHRKFAHQVPGVLPGGAIWDTIRLANGLPPGDNVFQVSLDRTIAFHVDTSNLHIIGGDSGYLAVHYVPTDTTANSATITLTTISPDSDTGCQTTISLSAPALHPTVDSAIFPLAPSTPNVVAIRTSSNATTLAVRFRNEAVNDAVIDSFYISGIDSLEISSHPGYPVTLHQNDSLELSLTYHKTQPGFQQGYLIVAINHTIVTEECVLEVQRLPNSSVPKSLSTTQTFWLYPNPSHGPITIHSDGVVNPHVKVTDVLGRTVREERFTRDWTWGGASDYGEQNEPGTYFIELSGITEQGRLVHEVRRVIIE